MPRLDWQSDRKLVITCIGSRQVNRRLARYRDITIGYRLTATGPRTRRPSRLW